jgi:DNA repair exonuclease SbcCD ATPase subunit
MIVFNHLEISNYKAISKASLTFEAGIYSVVGENKDGSYISNGASKSTIVQAITMALYNKDFYGASLDAVSNRYTKKPYKLILDFSVVIGESKVDYIVTNDRSTKRMTLSSNGKVISGTTKVLAEIEKILGMGYSTFKLTHFITGNTVAQLTQNLSQPTLFNDILQVVELQQLDKELFTVLKEVRSEIAELDASISTLESQASLEKIKEKYDLESLSEDYEVYQETLSSRVLELESARNKITPRLKELKEQQAELRVYIQELQGILKSGVCSVCGSILVDPSTIKDITQKLESHELSESDVQVEINTLESRWRPVESRMQAEILELRDRLSKIEKEVEIAINVQSVSTIDTSESEAKLKATKKQIIKHKKLEEFLYSSRKEIKAGNVVKSMLDRFFELVQFKISEYSALINMSHFEVSVVNDRLGMGIVVSTVVDNKKVDTPIETLSNGERTRLSLLILISMLDAMRIVSNCETNYLVFDEASSSFDASGIKELEMLFNHLKGLGQSCFIITHGSEMDAVPFDYRLTMTKNCNTSTAVITQL